MPRNVIMCVITSGIRPGVSDDIAAEDIEFIYEVRSEEFDAMGRSNIERS
jgi:hypothetical protein